MKIGDVSRQRRFADPARQRWYAHHRAVRFAFHMAGRRPEQVGFPEPMSRVKEDDTELYYQEAALGPNPWCKFTVVIIRCSPGGLESWIRQS